VICFYLVLLFISLPIPLRQHETDQAIERMRPVMKMDDGTYEGMLMPGDLLVVRWIGQLSWIVLFVVLVCFTLSFFQEAFARFETICVLAIFQSAYATFYALSAVLVFLVR
jgi:hypothetical protein